MKKLRLFLTAVLCAVLFTACEAKDPENVFEMPPTESVDIDVTKTETTATEPPVTGSSSTALEFDSPGEFRGLNMNQFGGFLKYGDDIVFAHIRNGKTVLYTLDMVTSKISPFCRDASCSHVSGKCPSSGARACLELYNGRLYGKNLAGLVVELQEGEFRKVLDGRVYHFYHANGNLYARTEDSSLVVLENGSENPYVLIDEFPYDIACVCGQYLYAQGQGIMRFDLSEEDPQGELIVSGAYALMVDGEYLYYLDMKDFYLYRCNMDGSGSELLLEQPVLAGSLNYDEDYLYFRLLTGYDPNAELDMKGLDSQDIYRMSKVNPTQVEKIAELPEPAREIYTVPGYDQLIVTNVTEQDEEVTYYAVAKDGSSVEKLELPDF